MENNKNIKNKVESTLLAMDTMEHVNVSPFFKDKTMQLLFAEKEAQTSVRGWFTPKLQLATLVCVVVLNVVAFTQINTSESLSYDENINQFAETYRLSTSSETSFLN
ncbi:hypothetical protein ACFFU1_13775 [Algibacter miyuki]|uniref:Uncharacterized protein n=1 Tax=Algibacter miyuki TaxID=1306933 RepID=A0ABV5H247_9FLAO|nr:hypothetical protein [Algibacter miyuki]MDN3666584.1 hypothetical protein [Algibacter miyuki]